MIDLIKKLLKDAATSQGIADADVNLEHPEDISHGDFSSNIAMIYAKTLKVAPKVLALKIVEECKKNQPKEIISIEVAGQGFINFFLSNESVSQNTKDILDLKENFGRQKIGNGKKVLVEYSSPNIAKPFTVGHLRSTIIGDSIANILDFLGYKVIRDNHLGDWGTQFGKLLFAIESMKLSSWEKIEKSDYPIKELVNAYVAFHDEVERRKNSNDLKETALELEEGARATFKLLESGKDTNLTSRWLKCIELSKKEFKKIYDTLDVTFDPSRGDTELGESFYAVPEKATEIIDILNKNNVLKDSEGAKVVFFENEKYPPLILQKSDGTTIYATRDLAADLYRKKTYGQDLVIVNEVGSEQVLYFKQLFEIEKMLGWFKEGERVHVAHGLYRFKDGKMSTRKGDVVWLKDIIDKAEKRAVAINPESAHDVAIGALKFNDLKRDASQDIIFDYDEIMNMTGDSGPYLQYSCVRASSIIAKAKEKGLKSNISSHRPDLKSLDTIERLLIHFPEIVAFSGSVYKPNIIATYLINLASSFNSFYASTTIAVEKDESTAYKMAVTEAFFIVMKNGLKLLGIKIPERM